MQDENWKYTKEYIQHILSLVQPKLNNDSFESVNHYLKYDEYEMAFEGLFLEIMKMQEIPKIDFYKSREIGEFLKLNEESVFDFEFWEKFENFLAINSRYLDSDDRL